MPETARYARQKVSATGRRSPHRKPLRFARHGSLGNGCLPEPRRGPFASFASSFISTEQTRDDSVAAAVAAVDGAARKGRTTAAAPALDQCGLVWLFAVMERSAL